MVALKERWVEVLILAITIVLSIGGSHVNAIKQLTITDERSKATKTRVDKMEVSWMSPVAQRKSEDRLNRMESMIQETREATIRIEAMMK